MGSILKTVLLSGAIFTVHGCGDRNAATVSAMADACGQTTNLNEAICACVAEKAKQELSPRGFEFLFATMTKNEEKVTELREKLAMPEVMAAGMFMVSAPASCTMRQDGG